MKDSPNDIFALLTDTTPPNVKKNDIDKMSLDEQKLKNDRYQKDTNWRHRLSWWVIGVDSVWLSVILLILALNNSYIHLSDPVLMMLLGTTTINVLGLAFIVLKGLFNEKSKYT